MNTYETIKKGEEEMKREEWFHQISDDAEFNPTMMAILWVKAHTIAILEAGNLEDKKREIEPIPEANGDDIDDYMRGYNQSIEDSITRRTNLIEKLRNEI